MSGRSGMGVWAVLVVCAAMIVGAMAWLTRSVMQAEHDRSHAESKARLEERIRLSLWRMDSVAAALVIEENQRVFIPGVTPPENPLARGRFTVGVDSAVSPEGDLSAEDLERLRSALDGQGISIFPNVCAAVHADNQWGANFDYVEKNPQGQVAVQQELTQQASYQLARNTNERAMRGKVINEAVSKAGPYQQRAEPEPQVALEASTGGFQPTWLGGEPFLLRQMRTQGMVTAIQGVWLDADSFRKTLLDEIKDLLPNAELEPTTPSEGEAAAMELASFPWLLTPGEKAQADPAMRGPVVTSLGVGWLAVAVALIAGMALVRGVMRLSERRASFVSAVTHELRTPLTTFRLYSDMLASGAVEDEAKRSGYFRTMRREADRLSHLVENVLSFSRIERKTGNAKIVDVGVARLLEGLRERFEERLAGAGLKLWIGVEGEVVARADAVAVEHVLFNLIDNAAKYAAESKPPEVRITATAVKGRVEIEVADYGPGIPASERGRVFRAFHKSAAEAAHSQPGVGLGLALSRRLARGMGGELECRDGPGARFVLVLPSA